MPLPRAAGAAREDCTGAKEHLFAKPTVDVSVAGNAAVLKRV